jgi:hypothetical protein
MAAYAHRCDLRACTALRTVVLKKTVSGAVKSRDVVCGVAA